MRWSLSCSRDRDVVRPVSQPGTVLRRCGEDEDGEASGGDSPDGDGTQ